MNISSWLWRYGKNKLPTVRDEENKILGKFFTDKKISDVNISRKGTVDKTLFTYE